MSVAPLRLLLLAHAFNGLTQRLFTVLREAGHEVTVELDISDAVTEEAVALARPDLVIAPFLKRRIPESVWSVRPCLVVHPGPPGDRGPAALDWAVLRGDAQGGVTVLQATGEFDAGRTTADDHEGGEARAFGGIVLQFGVLEREQDAFALFGGVFERFQARRKAFPFVAAEIRVPGAGG